MSAALRRALHEAVDLICDALAAEASGRDPPKPRRSRAQKVHGMPEGIDDETRKRAEAVARRAGWR